MTCTCDRWAGGGTISDPDCPVHGADNPYAEPADLAAWVSEGLEEDGLPPNSIVVRDMDRESAEYNALVAGVRGQEAARMVHMVIRQAQAAYAAGMRDGPKACMGWLEGMLGPAGNLPERGADPNWYASDAWTDGPPWPKPPVANATANEPPDKDDGDS